MSKLKNLIQKLIPPDKWRVPVIITLGIFTGLIIFTLYIGNAASYLSDKPETCINCHVMYNHYTSWQYSSHSRVATCNDCHVPQDNFVRKYMFKATDGLRHSTIFTLRLEPQAIRIKQAGADVVQENCKRCHDNLFTLVDLAHSKYLNDEDTYDRPCWDCHQETPHGSVNSLSTYPNSRVFAPDDLVPDWMKQQLNKK